MIRIKNLQRRNVDLMESTLIYALETVANLIAGGLNEIAQQALEQNYVLARSDLNWGWIHLTGWQGKSRASERACHVLNDRQSLQLTRVKSSSSESGRLVQILFERVSIAYRRRNGVADERVTDPAMMFRVSWAASCDWEKAFGVWTLDTKHFVLLWIPVFQLTDTSAVSAVFTLRFCLAREKPLTVCSRSEMWTLTVTVSTDWVRHQASDLLNQILHCRVLYTGQPACTKPCIQREKMQQEAPACFSTACDSNLS